MANISGDLSLYRNIGEFKLYKPNEIVFMQNETGNDMYLVSQGVFGVYINSFTDFPRKVAEITENGFFGEMSAIDGWPRSATIICEQTGSVVCVGRDDLVALLENIVDISQELLKTLIARAESTIDKVREAGKTVCDLPAIYKKIGPQDPQTDLDIMKLLANQIREYNNLLSAGQTNCDTLVLESRSGDDFVSLLPSWAKRLDSPQLSDNNNNIDNVADWNFTCPYCGKVFANKLPLFSKLNEKEKKNDGRIIYHNFNMLFYTNVICTNCNYCDTCHEFQKNTRAVFNPQAKGNQFKNYEGFTGFTNDYKRTLDEAALSCYLNLSCLKQVKNSELRQAKAWQRLYWLYQDFGEFQSANQSALQALKCYSTYRDSNINRLSRDDLDSLNTIIEELTVKE
jgi:CRP-like cAMP-binding protein